MIERPSRTTLDTLPRCLWYITYAKRGGAIPAFVAMERWDIGLRTFHRDAARLRRAGFDAVVESGVMQIRSWRAEAAA